MMVAGATANDGTEKYRNRSSIYPLHPVGSTSLTRYSGDAFTNYDRLVIGATSLFFVGGVFWVPAAYAWMIKRFRKIPPEKRKKRAIYAALIFSITALYAVGPHRGKEVGKWVNVKKWGLWKSWMRYLAYEIVADEYDSIKDLVHEQAILGISPHGIFPFGLGIAALSDQAAQAFGPFRVVVATAAQLIPWVRDILTWENACDASRPAVDRALADGDRLCIAPGKSLLSSCVWFLSTMLTLMLSHFGIADFWQKVASPKFFKT